MDVLRNFLDTTDAVTELVSRVPVEKMDEPAYGAWDLRSLIGHTSRAMSTVIRYLKMPATHVTCDDVVGYYVHIAQTPGEDDAIAQRGIQAGIDLGPDVSAGFASLARQVRGVLEAQPPGVDPVVSTLAGGMLLSHYLPTRTFELIVHGYDIAHAVDIDFTPHPDSVADTVLLAARVGIALGHGPRLVPVLTGRAGWKNTAVFSRAADVPARSWYSAPAPA